MKAKVANTLDGYVRHAEHYGVDEVFETALDEGLNLRDIGFLAGQLHRIDPRWKLTLENQRLLVLALVYAGQSAKDAASRAGCSLATARLWVDEDLDEREVDPDLALRLASKARFEHLKGIVRGWHRSS